MVLELGPRRFEHPQVSSVSRG